MFTETIQHLPYVGRSNNRGDAQPSWGTPVDIEATVDVANATQPRDGTARLVRVDFLIFAPPGFRCDYRDRFIVRGHQCQIEGVAEPTPNMFTGHLFPTEIPLRRVNG